MGESPPPSPEDAKPYFGLRLAALQGDPVRHRYMQAVVRDLAAERGGTPIDILEIGSYAGGSTLTWGESLHRWNGGRGRVVCIDSWRPYFNAARDEGGIHLIMNHALATGQAFELFLSNIRAAGLDDMVTAIRARSSDGLDLLREKRFSVAFIDGSHAYADVRRDLEQVVSLLEVGGILCGDDLEVQLSETNADAIRHIAESGADSAVLPGGSRPFHPGVTLAVGEMLGRVSCYEGFWAMRRTADGWEPVAIDDPPPVPTHLATAEFTGDTQDLPRVDGYNLVRRGDKVVAVSVVLGKARLFDEPIGCSDLPPFIFVRDTVEAAVDATKSDGHAFAELIGAQGSYNILRYLAVHQSMGPIDLIGSRLSDLPSFILVEKDEATLRHRVNVLNNSAGSIIQKLKAVARRWLYSLRDTK